jgi:hypothetical protein
MARSTRDLAAELFALLGSRSPDHAERWKALFINRHPWWTTGPLPDVSIQIREINEFWRVQLGMLLGDTLHARSCIVDNLEPDVWLGNFKRYVMEAVLYEPLPNQRWQGHCCA